MIFVLLYLFSLCWGVYYEGLTKTYSKNDVYTIGSLTVVTDSSAIPENSADNSNLCAYSKVDSGKLSVTLCPSCCPCKL
jgi:hypothetical protein